MLQHVPPPPVQRVMYQTPMYAPMYGQPIAQPVVVMPQGGMPAYYGGYPSGRCLLTRTSDSLNAYTVLIIINAWKRLPVDICNSSSLGSFRSRLKSHLFCAAQFSYRAYEQQCYIRRVTSFTYLLITIQYIIIDQQLVRVAQRQNVSLWPAFFRRPALDLQLMGDHLYG